MYLFDPFLRKLVALSLVAALLPLPTWADELRPFGRGSWQEIRDTHGSKPVVIHFWGVTCAPCRTEMPVWGALVKSRPDLRLVTIHADRIPSDRKIMTDMLAGAGLGATESWWFADRFFERLRFEVAPDWQGEIPMTLLISAGGEIKTIVGTAEPEDVLSWLDAEKGGTR